MLVALVVEVRERTTIQLEVMAQQIVVAVEAAVDMLLLALTEVQAVQVL